ncbi:MAG: hypothetical protein GKR87_02115 [Kiritimatiellae bacterium]|nr:hypothetical protein [Kiritimatiellia bacterium]
MFLKIKQSDFHMYQRFISTWVCFALLSTFSFAEESASTSDVHTEYFNKLYEERGGLPWQHDYPPATTCKECHPTHYRQWSVSPHAYGQMSPVFNAMHATIFKRTNGSNGDFCIRCHTPVGMNLEEPEFMSNIDRHPTSREGVTCIVCHRVNVPYGKI